MLRLLKRNPLLNIPQLYQITQIQVPFLLSNQISNGNLTNPQTHPSPFTLSFFSSSASNPRHESPKREDLIYDFFHSYGFTDLQIKRFIHKCPSFRSIEMIRPKLEYLLAFGFSPSDLIKVICYDHNKLASSLKERLKPNLSHLEATFGSKTHVIKSINSGPWLLRKNLEKHVIPNIKILQENGIPMEKITQIFTSYPIILVIEPNVIIKTISKLKGLGMNPSTLAFIHGIVSIAVFKKERWERKMELYRSFGWSEEDTLSAFSRQPNCLNISDDKIKKQMNFFIEKVQWYSTMVAKRPVVLTLSLEGRIIPRCAVLNLLMKRKIWNGKPKLYGLLKMGEKDFKERFVDKYDEEVPQVIDAYQGKLDFVGFETKY